MGSQVCHLLATLCVALPLPLFALGGAYLTGEFCLRILSYSKSTIIMGPNLDMVVVSPDIVGISCEELGWHVNIDLLCLVRARRFASLVVTLWGYKADGHPCTHLCPLA
jgi:hypothetical protein